MNKQAVMISATGVLPSTPGLSHALRLSIRFLTRPTAGRPWKSNPTTPHTQPLPGLTRIRFGLIQFRSPLLPESRLFSLPAGTEMFHFPAFPPRNLYFQLRVIRHDTVRGFPIRKSWSQRQVIDSTRLIADSHVLHRLLMPRHSPCALCSLTYLVKIFQSFAFNITKNISWLTSQYVLKLYINSCAIFKEQFLRNMVSQN